MTTRAITFYDTTIGKKVVMAVSGLIVVGWLLAHMLGNVTIFAGREAVNHYAELLSGNPPILWGQRIVLVLAIGFHVHAAFALWARNSDARPKAYYQRKDRATNYAALTMRYGGLVLISFIIFHIAHLTLGSVGPADYEFNHADVYNNVVHGFSNPIIAGTYIVAQCALAMHLYHGIWSLTQTLGVDHPKYNGLRQGAAMVGTLIIVLGFVSIPISVQTGILQPVPVDADGVAIEAVE